MGTGPSGAVGQPVLAAGTPAAGAGEQDEEKCVLDLVDEPHQAVAEPEAKDVLAGAFSVSGTRVAGVTRERFIEVLAGSKTVPWIDRQVAHLGLTDKARGSKRDKIAVLLGEIEQGRIGLADHI
eukprot:13019830-Alexandrium_andersonii.AAC.1